MVKGVISAGEAQFRGNLGLEVLLYVKIVISKGVIESRFELGDDGLEFGKALEVTVDEVSQMQREPEVMAIQLTHSLIQFRRALPVEPCSGWINISILAVSNKSE